MGRFELGFEGESASDPVGDGLEVLEAAIAARSAPGGLEQPIDRFDGSGGGVVFEVSKDPIKVPSMGSWQDFHGEVIESVALMNGIRPRGFTSQIPSQPIS